MREEAIREKLAPVRCFLLDMDGTFYLGNRLIEGSLDFLSALEKTGRTARFLTNNSSRSAASYREKLRSMGVPQRYCDVISSAHAAGRYCLEHFPGGLGYLLGNPALREEMLGMGLQLTQEHPDYVLVGFDTTLTYEKLAKACDEVRSGKPFVATHPDLNCPTETGFLPDIGAILAFIEASTGRRPDAILGKPYRGIVEEALRRTGFPLSQLAIVGDRLYTDVKTGASHGMTSILVLSGEATLEDVKKSDTEPDLIFTRLGDMIPYLSPPE